MRRSDRKDLRKLRDQIADLFATRLNLAVPSVDIDLLESGILDSLAFVTLLVRLEEEFGLKTSIHDLELDNFRSIARIADFVAARNGGNATG